MKKIGLPLSHARAFLAALCLAFWSEKMAAQSAFELTWLEKNRSSKDRLTEQLLRADGQNFHLLRAQIFENEPHRRVPYLEILTEKGARLDDLRLPLPDGATYLCAPANDSCLLLVWSETGLVRAQRFNFVEKRWSGQPLALFDGGQRAPEVWFRRSADGQRTCVFSIDRRNAPNRVEVAVFDAHFSKIWQRTATLPGTPALFELREVFMAKSGAVCLLARIYGRPNWGFPRTFGGTAHYFPDGREPANAYLGEQVEPYSLAVFALLDESRQPLAFYPETGQKHAYSAIFSENEAGEIYLCGLGSNAANDRADGYFVYQISPATGGGRMLQQAPMPAPARRTLLDGKAAQRKEPLENYALRAGEFAADGRLWLFAERENLAILPPGKVGETVVFKLDSAFQITATRVAPKNQNLPDAQCPFTASFAKIALADGGFALFWNDGHWPEAAFRSAKMKRTGGAPEPDDLDFAQHSGVSPLPCTLKSWGGKWYFVAESEYREKFRIGALSPAKGKK